MFVCQVFVWFVLYSIVGWVWESTYCTAVERTWQNRGFLYGPVCPIYGTGIVAIMLAWHALLERGIEPKWYQVFLVVMIGSAILEYTTHWALEKLFHAYWWDYSNMPLNLNGRICLPASIFFGLGGLLVVYVLYQPTIDIVSRIDPLVAEAASLVLMAAIAADTAITASSLASVARAASAINTGINAHMDRLVSEADERRTEATSTLQAAASAAREKSMEERERVVRRLRQSQLGQMSALTRSAMKRAMGAVSPDRLPQSENSEELAELWRAMLEDE